MSKNIFILRVEKYHAPERILMVNECYQSRTNAVKALKEYFEREKKQWLKDASWRTEEDFKSMSSYSSTNARISYGRASDSIDFKITSLKIKDL